MSHHTPPVHHPHSFSNALASHRAHHSPSSSLSGAEAFGFASALNAGGAYSFSPSSAPPSGSSALGLYLPDIELSSFSASRFDKANIIAGAASQPTNLELGLPPFPMAFEEATYRNAYRDDFLSPDIEEKRSTFANLMSFPSGMRVSPPRPGRDGMLSVGTASGSNLPRPVSSPTKPDLPRRISNRAKSLTRSKRNRRVAVAIAASVLLVIGWRSTVVSPGSSSLGAHQDAAGWKMPGFRFRSADQVENMITSRDHGGPSRYGGRRPAAAPEHHEHHAEGEGLSLLTQDEDELIAEDDLYWDSLPSRATLSTGTGEDGAATAAPGPDKAAAMLASKGVYVGGSLERELARMGIEDDADEIRTKLADIMQEKKSASLRALVHFLYDGGALPSSFGLKTAADEVDTEGQEESFAQEVANAKDLHDRWDTLWKKAGGRGVERALKNIGEEERDMFEHDWKKESDEKLKLVAFSKSYCPYSNKAKRIMDEYDIAPQPYIIELDQRRECRVVIALQ